MQMQNRNMRWTAKKIGSQDATTQKGDKQIAVYKHHHVLQETSVWENKSQQAWQKKNKLIGSAYIK